MSSIYILLSIKTRIETQHFRWQRWHKSVFISYYPLKQGLKRNRDYFGLWVSSIFISYYPLKQGVKHICSIAVIIILPSFISYYPLKQGLKPAIRIALSASREIYIPLSIKTRIETAKSMPKMPHHYTIYILLSIKTRIETRKGW